MCSHRCREKPKNNNMKKVEHRANTKAQWNFSPPMAWHTLLLCLWQRQQQQQKNEKSFNRHSLQDTNGEERRGGTIRYTTTFHQYSFVCNFLFAKHVIYFIKRKSSFHPILNKLSSPDSWLGCCSTKSHQNYYGWKSSYEYEEEEELSKNPCCCCCVPE